jgi:hypothetical protein
LEFLVQRDFQKTLENPQNKIGVEISEMDIFKNVQK